MGDISEQMVNKSIKLQFMVGSTRSHILLCVGLMYLEREVIYVHVIKLLIQDYDVNI